MGNCIICGTPVDGEICESHEEDAVFEFRGTSASQLTPGRYYRGTVDGYADFGVFVDIGDHVTGLLHRSELDQRLESLDWEPGDEVFVQVLDVRDNGNVDLGWSIRQREREFRGHLIETADDEYRPEDLEDEGEDDTAAETVDESDDESPAAGELQAAATEETEPAAAEPAGAVSSSGSVATETATASTPTTDAETDSDAEAEEEPALKR